MIPSERASQGEQNGANFSFVAPSSEELGVCKEFAHPPSHPPQLHFLRLPADIAKCHVVLMDATVATGAAAIMAIRVLLVSECRTHCQHIEVPLSLVQSVHVTYITSNAKVESINIILCQVSLPPPLPQDHDVAEDSILLVSLLMAELGVHTVAYAFPRVKLVTSAVDTLVNKNYHIVPGVGNYGDRYFGTGPD